MSDLQTEIKLTASADGVETGVARAKRSLADLSATAVKTGADGGKGMAPIGDGAEAAAKKVDSATRNMQASLQRQIAALEAGGTATRQYQESIAKLRGIDTNTLKPLLDQLDAAKRKADGAGQGMLGLGNASGLLQGQLAALAGSLTLGGMAAFVLQINNGIDALNDIKDATGSTIENISALEDIGKRTGASLDLVGSVLIKFNDVLSKAGAKSDIALQLQAIGLNAEELKRIDPAEALLRTAQALDKFADDGTKARLVQDLFGKSVKEAAPFLKDLAEKGALVAKVTTQQADEAERFNKQLFEMQANANQAGRNIVAGLIPGLNELAVVLATAARYGSGFSDSLRLIAMTRFGGSGLELGKDIAGVTKELDSLTAARERYLRANSNTTAIDQALAKEKERLAYLREVQRLTFRYDANDQSAAEMRRLTDSASSDDKPSIGPIKTAAEIAAAKAAAEAAAKAAAAARERELAEQKKFYADMAGLSGDYYDKLARAQKELAAGDITDAQYADYVEQLIKKQPFAIALTKEQTDANKALGKSMEEAYKAAAAYGKQLDDIALAGSDLAAQANARTDAVTAQIEATEFELGLMGKSNTERAIALKQYQIEVDLKKEIARINATIASKKDKDYAIDAAKKDADRAKANAAAEVVDTEFQRVSQQIEQSLTDALMRGFESGKDFAMVLRDTVVNMFKTMVLRPIVSAIVSPVAGAITGSLGLAGAANAATGAASGVGMLGSTLGALGTGLGAGASMIAGGGIGGWLSASTSLIGTGTLAGGMAGLGALAGPIGAVLAVASLIKSLDDSGTMHTGGLGGYSALTGRSTGDTTKGQGLDFDLASKDYTASSSAAAADIAQAVAGILDQTASAFGQKAGYFAATAFADDTSKDGAWGALMVKLGDKMVIDWKNGTDKWPGREFADGKAGAEEYSKAIAKDVRDYLITQTPTWADDMLSALGDSPTLEQLGQTVGQINAAAAALEAMGGASAAFAGLTEEQTTALVRQLGGAANATALLSKYYENYYSESERAALATDKLAGQFAAIGVAMPDSTKAMRGMIDAAEEAGNTTLAANLLKLSDAFAGVAGAAAAAAGRLADATMQYADVFLTGPETAALRAQNVANAVNKTLGTEVTGEQVAGLSTQQLKDIWRGMDAAGLTDAQQADLTGILGAYIKDARAAEPAVSSSQTGAPGPTQDTGGFITDARRMTSSYVEQAMELDPTFLNRMISTGQGSTGDGYLGTGLAWVSSSASDFWDFNPNRMTIDDVRAAIQADPEFIAKSLAKGIDPLAPSVLQPLPGAGGKMNPTEDDVKKQKDAAERLKSLLEERTSLEVELMRAQGNTVGALELLTAGFSEAEKAAYMYNEGLRAQIKGAGEQTTLQRQLLELQEDTAAIRALELAALEPANRGLQEQVWALEDLAKAAEKAKELTKELAAALPNAIAKYLTSDQNTAASYRTIAQSLVDGGLSGMGVDALASALPSTTKAQFGAMAAEIYQAAGTTDTMRLSIVKAADAFADLKDAAASAAEQMAQSLTAAIAKYLSPEQNAANSYRALAQDLIGAGVSGMGVDALTANLMTGSKAQFAALATQIYNAAGTTDTMRLAIIKAASAFADLKDSALQTAIAAADDAFGGVERAVAAQRKLAETSRTAAQTLVTEVKGVFDSLQSAVDDLFGRTDSTKQWQAEQGQQFITSALAAARATGALPDGKDLSRAISAATGGLDAMQYANQAEADFARLVLANELQALQGISGKQLTEAERQLQAAEDSLTALDQTLDTARDQLDELKGINKGVASLPDALATFAASLAAAAGVRTGTGPTGAVGVRTGGAGGVGTAAGGKGAGGFYSSPLSNWEQTAGTGFIDGNGIQRDTAGLALPMDMLVKAADVTGSLADVADYAKANGLTVDDVAAAYQQLGYLNTDKQDILDWAKNTGVPAFADGGWHAGGWAMVGERGPELAYMPPAQIYTAPQTASMLGGGNSAEVVAELRLLREQNARLEERLARIETHTDNTATGLVNVTRGNALVMKTAESAWTS